jgi:hypothetical protein
VDQALTEIEEGNTWFKKRVADLTLREETLNDVVRGNF